MTKTLIMISTCFLLCSPCRLMAGTNVVETVLKVTGDRNYPPYSFLDNGIPTGFDIDIIRAIAKTLNLEIEISLQRWSDARSSLELGFADIIPGMVRIPSRDETFAFSAPIKHLTFDIFVGESSAIKTKHDAYASCIVVQQSGVMYDLIKQGDQFIDMSPVGDAPEGLLQLLNGSCDGALINKSQGHYLIKKHAYTGIRNINAELPTLPYCIAVRHGSTELLSMLNEGLHIIRLNGTYDTLYDKWFTRPYTVQFEDIKDELIWGLLIVLALILFMFFMILVQRRKRYQVMSELRSVIDLSPFYIFARNRKGRYILCNQSAAESMGYSTREITGRKHSELFPDEIDKHEEYFKEDQQVFDTGAPLFIPETSYKDKLGKERVLQVTKVPFQWKDGQAVSVLCTAVDITSLKAAERDAESNRENLLAILNSIKDAVIAVDSGGRITMTNHVAEKIFDLSGGIMSGMKLNDIISITHEDGEPFELTTMIQTRPSGESDDETFAVVVVQMPKGNVRDIELHWAPIRSGINITGMVFVMRDITEHLIMNKHLQDTQKMESIGRLAGGVAHDFNNLLAGIVGYTELLNTKLERDRECREYLKGIFDASERAGELVQQLLTFSRRHPKENVAVDLHTVIGHVVSLLRHTVDRKISIVQNITDTSGHVLGDRSQLQNALLNLGINARDAMPDGGVMTIESRRVLIDADNQPSAAVQVKPGPYIEISIQDTGTGMDEEILPHIFEPFFTTKSKSGGSGLGLSAVYGTVNDHGGCIDVKSQVGEGTTFRLWLPLVDAQTAETTSVTASESMTGTGCILLVDDEPYIIKTQEAILRDLGYKTMSAPNGRMAIEIFKANTEVIDLVILDMIMPDMNGQETFKQLKAINPHVKVLLSSGYLQEHTISDLMGLGIISVLQKPFRKDEFALRVKKALRFQHRP